MITAEELEKLAELKDKGIISEDEFNAKRSEFLGQSSTKKSGFEHNITNIKPMIYVGLFIFILIGSIYYVMNRPSKIDSSGGIGKSGFTISISCQFNGSQMPLQSCTGKSEAVMKSGADRRSYNGYSMPSTYNVPEHFDFYIYNGSDKFTIDMSVIDKATGSTVSHRQVGPYDGDRIGN